MGLIAAVAGDRWHPGIGDPTVLGWATVVAYAASFVLCVMAVRRARRASAGRTVPLWAALAAMMLLLGVNKQLDLQSWFTQEARDLLSGRGLYAERRTYQAIFIALVAAAGVATAIALGVLTVRRRWPLAPALGATFLVAYVVIRAASFHHVDQIINLSVPGARLSSVIELAGIAVIGVAAARAVRARPGASAPKNPLKLIEAVARFR